MFDSNWTISDIQKHLRSGETTCVEIASYYLENAKQKAHLNCFVSLWEKDLLAAAREQDAEIKQGTIKPLSGCVIGVKDNICFKGKQSTASSRMLGNYTSVYDATVISELKIQGALFIGALNCDEFAMGSSNENSFYGPVKNPRNEKKVPGGSSGGSAAAVAANLCHIALGSDTGGSIRQPASFCGVVGMKPTYGAVSRYGLIAFCSSMDQIGPFGRNLEDTQSIVNILSKKDPKDSTTWEAPEYLKEEKPKKKIAFLEPCVEHQTLLPEIRKATLEAKATWEAKGYTCDMVEFPLLDFLVPTYSVLTTAEASSNLSRFDGVHLGVRSENAGSLEEIYTKSRTEGFGKEVKRRILLGTFVLSSGYCDEYFTKAQKVRGLLQKQTNTLFEEYDAIVSPTTPKTAFDLGIERTDPTELYLEDIYTVHANLCGLPSLSIPIGNDKENMPFGLQITAQRWNDSHVFDLARELEEK